MFKGRKIAVIGAGKMGGILIEGLLNAGALEKSQIVATAKHEPTLESLRSRFGIDTSLDNAKAVTGAKIVLLCVKPQAAERTIAELRSVLTSDQLLISIVASLTTENIEAGLDGSVRVLRCMPNTPSAVGAGMSALCAGRFASAEDLADAERIFGNIGRTIVLDEKHFDAVTAVSASGPAFIYIVIEALAEGGVKVGLPRDSATMLAAQACLGAAKMVLDSGTHPAVLKDEVTTPAGCTIDGILKLEEGGLRVTLIKSIVEATQRASALIDS